jgi:hypothetical protein
MTWATLCGYATCAAPAVHASFPKLAIRTIDTNTSNLLVAFAASSAAPPVSDMQHEAASPPRLPTLPSAAVPLVLGKPPVTPTLPPYSSSPELTPPPTKGTTSTGQGPMPRMPRMQQALLPKIVFSLLDL